MTAAAGYDLTQDRRAATIATFAFAPVHAMFQLKESLLAIGIDVIGNRRPAFGDSLAQYVLHCTIQAMKIVLAERGCAPARTNAGPEQGLISINVADAAQQFLI